MKPEPENRPGFDPDLFAETLAPLHGESWQTSARPKTLGDLSWDQLLGHVAERAKSPEGLELVDALRPLPTKRLAQRRLLEVGEWMELLSDDDDAPIYGLRDIRKAVAYAAREGVLVAEDLESIGRNCDVVARAARFFKSRHEQVPYLRGVADLLDSCDDLREALGQAIEPGGRLADSASPDLRRLRRSVQNHTDRIKSAVDRLLTSSRYEHILQDDYFTVREDRYVLPVRVGAKTTVDGIVHGYSSSGRTAFIEPQELIELNNQLRWAQIEVQEEELRILTRLSAMVARAEDVLRRNTEVIAYLDLTGAIARLGRAIDGVVPAFSDHRELRLANCRHPLLFLKLQPAAGGPNPTVPNDVVLDPDKRVLVVSGPNTGGKTVLLKAFGFAALMARCGMPIAADPGSTLPFYRAIFTDIGDEQSIERDLSTFSGHLTNIAGFLNDCDERSLILLDELFTGTDPMQGAALAVALLEELARRGATTTVTTHLEGLKTLALESELFANAAMGFDIETLAPTYRVTLGIPGSSFAMRIADRLGFPSALIDRATEVLEADGRLGIDQALTKLDEQVSQLGKEQKRLEHERRLAEQAKQKFQDKHARLLERDREAVLEETQKLRERLAEARRIAKERLKELKQSETLTRQQLEAMRDELRDADAEVDSVRGRVEPPPTAPEGLVQVNPIDLAPGMVIYAAPFKRNADVLEIQGNEIHIQVGPLKATLPITDAYHPNEQARRRQRSSAPSPIAPEVSVTVQSDRNTVDLRGLRADEAIEKLDLFLDTSYLARVPGIYIIHGHGTGALKRAVRGFLPDSSYVREFRPGERGEGGDGVTVAYLS